MARYATPCTNAEAYDIFIALRDDMSIQGIAAVSSEYGVGLLTVETDSPLPQSLIDKYSLTEVT